MKLDLEGLRYDVEYMRKLGPLGSQHEVVNGEELEAILRECEAGRKLRERMGKARLEKDLVPADALAEYDAAVGVE